MSGETMLVEAIAETLDKMKKEDPMGILPMANEAKAMADDYYNYSSVLKAIAKLIRINASNGNYECYVDFCEFETDINKERVAFLLRQEGYKVIIAGQFMRIHWGK